MQKFLRHPFAIDKGKPKSKNVINELTRPIKWKWKIKESRVREKTERRIR